MKDAYSFDRDDDGLARSYGTMKDAYRRIFDRCGFRYVVVEADPGQIGGGLNHPDRILHELQKFLKGISRHRGIDCRCMFSFVEHHAGARPEGAP